MRCVMVIVVVALLRSATLGPGRGRRICSQEEISYGRQKSLALVRWLRSSSSFASGSRFRYAIRACVEDICIGPCAKVFATVHLLVRPRQRRLMLHGCRTPCGCTQSTAHYSNMLRRSDSIVAVQYRRCQTPFRVRELHTMSMPQHP